jgi:hypothetical protein
MNFGFPSMWFQGPLFLKTDETITWTDHDQPILGAGIDPAERTDDQYLLGAGIDLENGMIVSSRGSKKNFTS